MKSKADILFESSWEVCNKVGGIYTVVKSKANLMKQNYSDYFLIGPYFEEKARVDFEKTDAPDYLKKIFEKLKNEGIICHHGIWNIEGEPSTILIDSSTIIDKKDQIKEALWESYKVDSISSNWDFDEPLIWSFAISRLLEEVYNSNKEKKIVAHFHEWLAGSALLHLKKNDVKIATVFTTHATMLGRSLAGSGRDLYGILDDINPEEEAYKSGIQDKFTTERACAQNTDIFTTVSEITGMEAEKILGRKPEVLVLNGLDIGKFPTIEEISIKHVTCRDILREFLIFYFFPHYSFNINHTMILFIVGRYEFKNKGIDVFIKALGKMNERLKNEGSERVIIALFWIPQETSGLKIELLENKNYYMHIKNYVEFNSDNILSNILYDFISGASISKDKLFTKEFLLHLKKDTLHFKRTGNPPLSTHNTKNDNNDPILNALKEQGLNNKQEDKVKAILYPVYLDGNDGLTNLSYYDAMAGCHLGVFPSSYEPWGYTPLEAGALGVPSITSDLAGFGRFIQTKLNDNMEDGMFVLKRFGKSEEEVVDDFTRLLYKFSARDKRERTANKLDVKNLSGLADWKILIENYIKAHNMALEKLS